MSKKTVKVKEIVDIANEHLARTDEFGSSEFKAGVCVMVEEVLRKANAYNGFYHLDPENCDLGTIGYYSRRYYIK